MAAQAVSIVPVPTRAPVGRAVYLRLDDVIRLHCHCGNKLTVSAERRGQRGKCPRCGSVMIVPDITDVPDGVAKLVRNLREDNTDGARSLIDALGTIDPLWTRAETARGAVLQFVSLLGSLEIGVRLQAVRALGAIGDRRATEPLVTQLWAYVYDLHQGAYVENLRRALNEIDANWFSGAAAQTLLPVRLTNIEVWSGPEILADARRLIQTQDGLAADSLLKLLFFWPGFVDKEIHEGILQLTSCSALTNECAERIIEASRRDKTEHLTRVSGHDYQGRPHTEGFFEASVDPIVPLCGQVWEVSSNILHLVAHRKSTFVNWTTGRDECERQEVSFQKQRELALVELGRRGSPPYAPGAYRRTPKGVHTHERG